MALHSMVYEHIALILVLHSSQLNHNSEINILFIFISTKSRWQKNATLQFTSEGDVT